MQKNRSDWTTRTKKNTIRLAFWTVTWIISLAVATFGHLFLWGADSILSIIVIFTNLLVGFGMIVANKNHLKGLDEMQQKIQLDAMAISLGVGIVCGISYSLLDQTNLISYNAEISHLIILMSLTYMAGTIIGRIRYQ